MTRYLMLALVLALLATTPVLAEDVNAPPWDPASGTAYRPQWDGGVTTSQTWEFEGAMPLAPTTLNNPFGEPMITVLNGYVEFQYEDPDTHQMVPVRDPHGNPTGAIYIPDNGTGGTINITIPNNPDPNDMKLVFIQITSDKGIDSSGITSVPAGALITPSGYGPTPWGVPPNTASPSGMWWYTYPILYGIPNNPASETLTIPVPPNTWIEEIVVKTTCVPEPASLALLGLGALGLLRRRR